MKKKENISSFKHDIQRLEEIASLLENEEIELEEAIKLYEEGVELSKKCLNTLKNTELKITELKNKMNIDEDIPVNMKSEKNGDE
jgi:exodeoxyribonuclease VII small subunit